MLYCAETSSGPVTWGRGGEGRLGVLQGGLLNPFSSLVTINRAECVVPVDGLQV